MLLTMHYDPKVNDHGLPHAPFKAIVAPRPIGWISSVSERGVVNLAPYSFFNAIHGEPPFVMFASSTPKDSQRNVEASGEFVANLATEPLAKVINESSAGFEAEISEPEAVGIEMAPSLVVRAPRVRLSPTALECRYVQTIPVTGADGTRYPGNIVIGEVVSIYVDDAAIRNGRLDLTITRPLSRLGYMDYAGLGEIFEMQRPNYRRSPETCW